jgi:hypothetical protein
MGDGMSQTFSYGPATYNLARLHGELVAAAIGDIITVRGEGDGLTATDIEVEVGDAVVEANVDTVVAAHTGTTPPPHFYPELDGSTDEYVRGDGTLADPHVTVGGLFYSNTSVPAGNTVANDVAATAFASSYTIAGGTLVAGDVVRVRAWGVYGTDAVAPTLTLRVKAGSTVLVATSAVTMPSGVTNLGWMLDASLSIFTIGAGGTVDPQAIVSYSSAATTTLAVHVPATSTSALDTTASNALTVEVEWGTADAQNTITLRQLAVEILRA